MGVSVTQDDGRHRPRACGCAQALEARRFRRRFERRRLAGWQGAGGLALHDRKSVRGWRGQRTIEEVGGARHGIAAGDRVRTWVGGRAPPVSRRGAVYGTDSRGAR